MRNSLSYILKGYSSSSTSGAEKKSCGIKNQTHKNFTRGGCRTERERERMQ
jgi:hypothetical protein